MKINYKGMWFDSQLEVDYYDYLSICNNDVVKILYHPHEKIQITKNNKYTPDFIVEYSDRVEVVETKGYNQFSFQKDNLTHSIMLSKTEDELREFIVSNGFIGCSDKIVKYRKVKHLKAYGFVDWDFKNPNTQAKKNAQARDNARKELKDTNSELKDFKRYFKYTEQTKKLTKNQSEWYSNFIASHRDLL